MKNSSNIYFKDKKAKNKYRIRMVVLLALALLITFGLLTYNNPVAIDSPSFIPVVKRRQNAIIAMALAAICQSIGSIVFQTTTNNRIITPSILGFEAIYTTINTAMMFIFGISTFVEINSKVYFIFQILLMVGVSLLLFMGIFYRKGENIELMLLVGVILGQGLRSISSFMRRLLSPSEFDILQARLFASVNNSNPEYFLMSAFIIIAIVAILIANTNKLNVLALGKDVAKNLGVDHKKLTVLVLVGVSILISISTALVGPMTFFGFLVATLSYELIDTFDHKRILAMGSLLAYVILSGSYFIMNHIFNANGVVSVLIELIGGLAFLIMIFRKEKI